MKNKILTVKILKSVFLYLFRAESKISVHRF